MPVAIFDLDNTLITSDSDFLWGEFLVEHNIVDPLEYEQKNRQFYEDYQQGRLDIESYLRFSLKPLARYPLPQLHQWRAEFIQQIIEPLVAPGTPALLDEHRQRGDTLLIISATNLFITEPIAELLEVPHILSTVPEIRQGRYTGDFIGTPTYQHGKVTVLQQWLEQQQMDLNGSSFYSDSHNDLPLLELVDHPVAVNPDDILQKHAQLQQWPIIDLRH